MRTLKHGIRCACGAEIEVGCAVPDDATRGDLMAFVARLLAAARGWAVDEDEVRCADCCGPASDRYVSLVADGLTVGVPMSASRARALAALLVKAADAAEAGAWTGEPWSVES